MRKAITVAISLPAELAEGLTKEAQKLGVSKSLIVQQLLRVHLKQNVASATNQRHTKQDV